MLFCFPCVINLWLCVDQTKSKQCSHSQKLQLIFLVFFLFYIFFWQGKNFTPIFLLEYMLRGSKTRMETLWAKVEIQFNADTVIKWANKQWLLDVSLDRANYIVSLSSVRTTTSTKTVLSFFLKNKSLKYIQQLKQVFSYIFYFRS